MKNKKVFKLFIIVLGIIMMFGATKVQASEITSIFSEGTLTRSNLQDISQTMSLSENSVNATQLQISGIRKSGNAYTWNPNTVGDAKNVWKIAVYNSSARDYSNLYYCLNAVQGFGITSGQMAEGAIDEYPEKDNLDITAEENKSNIITYSGGKLGDNYNKILWILDNSYIPTGEEEYQKDEQYKNLMKSAGIAYTTEIRIDDETVLKEELNLTEDDIEVVQQMAIWYFTNSDNSEFNNNNLPSLYINGTQLSDIWLATNEYGTQITGKIRQEKAEKLYKYFIENASAEYTRINAELELLNSNATVTDKEDHYIVGPFEIEKTNNVTLNEVVVKINDNKLSSEKYSIISSVDNTIVTDYSNLTKFSIKIDANEVSNKSDINVNVIGKYSERELTFMTNSDDYTNTQPVVLVKTVTKPINAQTSTSYEITGKYKVILRKVDENGKILLGSKFELNGTEYDLINGEVIIKEETDITSKEDICLTYQIIETVVPEGYKQVENKLISIEAKVKKEENTYKLVEANLVDSDGLVIEEPNISLAIEDNSIIIIVKNEPVDKEFDLSLRKFVTKVNNIEYSREPIVDTSTIVATGNATYKHTKQPIVVQKGDIVTYTIRVYNEGEIDGYAESITDNLPKNLLPIIEGVEGIDKEKYQKEIEFNSDWGWSVGVENSVTTYKTSKSGSDIYYLEEVYPSIDEKYKDVTDTKLNAFEEGKELDYIDVQIKCLVAENSTRGEYLTNIAEITQMCDALGVEIEEDRDSKVNNAINEEVDLSNYKNEEAINSTVDSYIKGQEDDDDFEKLVVKEFDLSLRKFISKVNETSYSRAPIVDTTKLGTLVDEKLITTAKYTHSKEPVIVKTGDLVVYTIRIYNEGNLNGFASEITDNIPEGLEFLPNSDINISYKWKMLDKEGNITEDVSKAIIVTTSYLSDDNSNNEISAVLEKEGVKTLSYKDVEVQFKVVAKPENLKDNIIINEAQISQDSERDIDSVPTRNEKYDYDFGKNEDDIDYEKIKLQYFDLALRKFVTKVNNVDYNNRYPEIKYNDDGSITYINTKDPVLVTTGDVVIYTIRVYNEGEIAGTATQIIDDLPEGLEFIEGEETNKKYGWELLDGEGIVTEDITKAVKVRTNYLKDESIAPLVKEGTNVLSYKDVQIAFEVTEPDTSDRILVNTAQILEDNADDIDSIPGNDILTEDDIDKEYVKVQYFDLSLKKWVTKTIVTLDGKTTTTETKFTEDSDEIAKVDIVASKLKKTTVKFVYNIKVINEGEMSGYAYEVRDYIPKGLKFVAEDNEGWKQLEDGSVVTNKLENTLLNPGESAVVELTLTWENSTTNLGLKTNYAEISNDSGNDIDSIPDNFSKEEDDIDDAQIIISIKTAGTTTYIGLILITIIILAGGIFLIKKYVLD